MAVFEPGNFSLGTLIGLVLGAFLGHSLAIRRGKWQVKHNAAIEFRKRVLPALDALENGESQFSVIQNSYETHCKAAVSFSAFLKGRDLESFKEALSAYRFWRETVYGRSTAEILYDTNDPEYLAEKEKSAQSMLSELLKYAET